MLEAFLREMAQIQEEDNEFTRTVQLFDAGYIDSIGVVSLMDFIETSFGIELAEEDLFDERFATINGMSEIIACRMSRENSAAAHRRWRPHVQTDR
jgi:acyl carrier protein